MLGGPEIATAPRVSPDRWLVAFQAMIDGDTQVAVLQPESGDWTVLTHDRHPPAPPLMSSNAVRSDGTIIKTASYSDSWTFTVVVLNPATGKAQRITWPFFLDTDFAGWTASGQIVAFTGKMNATIRRLRPVIKQ